MVSSNAGHFGVDRTGTLPVISPGGFHTPPPPSNCAGCGFRISDRFYLYVADRQWHSNCLKCHGCKATLDQEMSCFFRDGHIYCKEDYYKLVAVTNCSRCQGGIFAANMVMRVRDHVYHLQCFRCAWCNAPLESGDFFGLRDNLVYCQQHYDGAMAYEAPPLPLYGPPFEAPPPPQGRKGRPRKKKQAEQDVQKHVQGLSPIDPSGLSVHMGHLDGGARTPSPQQFRPADEAHAHLLQAPSVAGHEGLLQREPEPRRQRAQETGLEDRTHQEGAAGVVPEREGEVAEEQQQQQAEPRSARGMMGSEHSPNSQLHPMGLLGNELCSPDGVSSYSESSPVHSCGGVPSDGSLSTHVGQGQSMDFDSSNPLTPIINHHGHNPIHNGDPIMHMTSFQNLF